MMRYFLLRSFNKIQNFGRLSLTGYLPVFVHLLLLEEESLLIWVLIFLVNSATALSFDDLKTL